ncbi:MAG TPA: hypothetical protein VKB09_14335, partial [Thermomicrobiales bacterium]|nr:hypothetical protein [Thermomicrobiales bacterium]
MRKPNNGEVMRVGRIEEAKFGAARPGTSPEEADADGAGETKIVTRQATLPLPWQLIRAADEFSERDFAHPAELDFSRILSFYRIRWAYEPTTFSLAYSAEGRPSEMFTPDFYLPEHKLYIELTTMRQRLVTRKNRKIRRLRELYPNVRIKLLYRRDCDRLGDAYRRVSSDAAACRAGRVIFDEDRIHERIDQLATSIAADTQEPNEHHRVSTTPAPSRSSHGSAPQAVRLPIWQVTGPA